MARRHVNTEARARRYLKRDPQAQTQLSEEKRRIKHYSRILHFQQRWGKIKDDLPPQFSRRHSTLLIPPSSR